jgi:hypothetical protein
MRFLADWLLPRCIVASLMIAGVARSVPAGAYLNCSTTRVVIVSAATGDTSSRSDENLNFIIDDAAKTLTFADGGSLRVTRFDKTWISANRDDVFYEFNRQDGTLSFASATTKNNITSTIVGSGRCKEMGAAGDEREVVAPEADGGHIRDMTGPKDIAVVRIELEDIEPLIWRRVAVPTSMTLKAAHRVIQAAMGWLDHHLWAFTANERKYGMLLANDPNWNDRFKDAAKTKLCFLPVA